MSTINLDGPSALAELLARHKPPPPDPLAGLTFQERNKILAPNTFSDEYAPHHIEFWEWLDSIEKEARPKPIECLWPRGHSKSSAGEMTPVVLGSRNLRSYFLYVSGTQNQANDHLASIQAICEAPGVQNNYPHLASPKVGVHGNQKGYTQKRLWTPGLIVDAVGLDVGRRGAKLEEQRPDGLILDDIDHEHDSAQTVAKKIDTITKALIPALTKYAVILLLNNLVHPNAIVAQLIAGRLDMLSGAKRIGPLPALEDMDYKRVQTDSGEFKWKITKGIPTWKGMGIEQCEQVMNDAGEHAFLTECQQEITEVRGALLKKGTFDQFRWSTAPPLEQISVSIDPNKTGRADDAGVIVGGRAEIDGVLHAFILEDLSQTTTPDLWRDEAARAFLRHQAVQFIVERTGLGQHASLTIRDAPALRDRPFVSIEPVDAVLSKLDRARPVQRLYLDGRVHHIGYLPGLEGQWRTWVPKRGLSPGAVDACVHLVTKLLIDAEEDLDDWSPDQKWIEAKPDRAWGERP